VTFIKIRSHRRKFSNSDSVEQKNKLYDISNLKLSVLSKWFKHLDLRFFIFRALFRDSLVLKVISFDRVAVLICSVSIFLLIFLNL
jgi:hypothetical protein